MIPRRTAETRSPTSARRWPVGPRKPTLFLPAALSGSRGQLAALVLATATSAAFSARAQEVVTWGKEVYPGRGTSSVEIAPGTEWFADVTCRNELTAYSDTFVDVSMELYGVPVRVLVTQGGGDRPDTFELSVPDGFIAVPSAVTIGEGEAAVIRIIRVDEGTGA